MTTRAALLETKAVLRLADRTWARWSCPSTAECCQLATTRRPPWLWPSEWAVRLVPFLAGLGELNHCALRELAASEPAMGLLAYEGDEPAGWCACGFPRRSSRWTGPG